MKILALDIWGDFGHFKKFYTTSSPLSFSIPPPTAVFGMIGAILGLGKKEYLKHINGRTTKVGIRILKPIKKTRMTINLIDTKKSGSFHLIKGRTQIKTEFLKEPSYRLYINISKDELFNQLINKVKNKETYYTLSLGLANLIANFKYIGVFDGTFLEKAEMIDSVVPLENVENLSITEGKKYFKEKLPTDMKPHREVISYKDIIMELNGKPLEGSFKNCYKVGNEIICFM